MKKQLKYLSKYLKVHHIATTLLFLGVILGLWYLGFGGYLRGDMSEPDYTKAQEIQPFFAGIVVPMLTLGSALLVYGNLRNTSRQNFSSNFFKLIEMHHKLRDNMSEVILNISDTNSPSKGKDVFDDLCQRIYYDYTEEIITVGQEPTVTHNPNADATKQATGKTGRNRLCALYDYYFHVHHSSLGHYFRNLYYLVKYADESSFSTDFKTEHLRILRAQLSNYELLLLAYNCLHQYGEKFYPLVEKYEFLKSLNNESRLHENYVKRIIDINVLIEAYPNHKKYFASKALSVSEIGG